MPRSKKSKAAAAKAAAKQTAAQALRADGEHMTIEVAPGKFVSGYVRQVVLTQQRVRVRCVRDDGVVEYFLPEQLIGYGDNQPAGGEPPRADMAEVVGTHDPAPPLADVHIDPPSA